MAKKPVMPGELKNLLDGVNHKEETKKVEKEEVKVEKNSQKETKKEKKIEYVDSGSEAIDRVIKYAQQYKESDIEMATVVLSDDMKQMLDKLRTSLPVKTSFKYLLSAMIKDYFETHKKEITDLILKF